MLQRRRRRREKRKGERSRRREWVRGRRKKMSWVLRCRRVCFEVAFREPPYRHRLQLAACRSRQGLDAAKPGAGQWLVLSSTRFSYVLSFFFARNSKRERIGYGERLDVFVVVAACVVHLSFREVARGLVEFVPLKKSKTVRASSSAAG